MPKASALDKLEEIDALEIVPSVAKNNSNGWNPFEGVKISAFRAPEVKKLVSELEAENEMYKTKLENISKILKNNI